MARLSAQERKQAIIEAAMPLFAQQGFDAVTTRQIAEAAGVSEALLYRHFRGKEDLYHGIMDACVSEATQAVDMLADMPNDTRTLVLCVYALVWKIQKGVDEPSHACVRRLAQQSLLQDGEFMAQFLSKTSKPWVAKMTVCIEAAIEAGDVCISQEDASLAIWLAHHASVTISNFKVSSQAIMEYPGGSEHLVRRTAEITLRGMGMTQAAIDQYFQPETFDLLLSQSH